MGSIDRYRWTAVLLTLGLAFSANLVSIGQSPSHPFTTDQDEWRYRVGTSEASTPDISAWRFGDSFDDLRWRTGRGPFHTSNFEGATPIDVSRATSLYLRQRFVVEDPNQFSDLILSAQSDDGFVAWINGHEVVRYNVPSGDLRYSDRASRSVREPIPTIDYTILNPRSLLVPGENLLAVHAFSASSPSSRNDLLFDAILHGHFDNEAPSIEAQIPQADRTLVKLDQLEVFFSEPVTGVQAQDLLINELPALEVRQLNGHQYLFTTPSLESAQVQVQWISDHGIEDLAGNPFQQTSWGYRLEPDIALTQVQITEFMASNDSSLNDENGDRTDWIEVYNGSEADIPMKDWALTDSAATPEKWLFPDLMLPSGEYLLVFASGKDRSQRFGQLHTNFKLSADGEYLALRTPSGQITTEFTDGFPEQFPDVSYGTIPGTSGTNGYFVAPTPRKPNQAGGQGFAPEVQFTRRSATFTEDFQLLLETDLEGVTIKYSLDGSLPNQDSRTYRRPILITDSTEIRARAFHPELLPGPPRSETFTKLDSSVAARRSTLPIMVISRLGRQRISGSRNTPVHFSIFEPRGGTAYLLSEPDFANRGAAKTRGSSTGGLAKASWAIEWRDEFGEDQDHAVLGMPAESEWVLYAPNQFDPIMIHNPFIHQLSRDIGDYSPRTRFVEIYLNEGGPLDESDYKGIYVLEEKISIGRNRVNIDKLRPENVTLPEVSGGYLLKIDRPDPGDSGMSTMGTRVLWVDPKEDDIETRRGAPQHPQAEYIKQYLDRFHATTRSEHWRDPEIGYHAFIETEQWVNFHILEVLSGNVDSLVLSTYFHKPRNGKLVFGPHWDFDRALGSTDGRDANPASWTNGPFFSAPPFGQLLRDPDFWQLWVDRWQELREDQFSLQHINGLIDHLTNQIKPAVPRELKRWRTRMRGGTYETEIAHMKNWLRRKIEFIDRQMTQPPTFNQPSGYLEPTNRIEIEAEDGAQIYYTTDGTDPRLSDGKIAPQARRYRVPLTVTDASTILARARLTTKRQTAVRRESSTPWSRPIKRMYTPQRLNLVISEIMFHPAPLPGQSTDSESDFEFIELLNTGDTRFPLEGLRFVSGIDYHFPDQSPSLELGPGDRLVIARNAAKLKERHPTQENIVGNFTANLSNNQDRITLVDAQGIVIADIEYNDRWNFLADGVGFSLVFQEGITNQTTPPSPSQWRASSYSGGSPGTAEPLTAPLFPIYINELQAFRSDNQPDRVELFNPTDQPVDLSGWFLTDTLANPRQLKIKSGTTIAPQEHLTLTEQSFSQERSLRLNRLGDALFLLSATEDQRLSGWVDGVAFRGSDTDLTYGRYIDSAGTHHFAPISEATFGQVNAAPLASRVVVKSINYQSQSGENANLQPFEFIEIVNPTLESVPLFLESDPEITWRLRGAVDFDFPPNLTLAPGQSLTIVGFNPQTDPARFSDFANTYSIPPTAIVLGPWRGALDNAGERIELLAPVPPPTTTDQVAFIAMEDIPYSPFAPWPHLSPDTSEVLTRVRFEGFSGDPSSWTKSLPVIGDQDRDQDGLPDQWELTVGLDPQSSVQENGANGDPDGDGLTNQGELKAGTHPLDPTSTLAIHIQSEEFPLRYSTRRQPIVLTIQTVPGRRYSLYATENLIDPEWTLVQEFLGTPDSNVTEIRDGLSVRGRDRRYYRVVTP